MYAPKADGVRIVASPAALARRRRMRRVGGGGRTLGASRRRDAPAQAQARRQSNGVAAVCRSDGITIHFGSSFLSFR
jgi:hypothetical protein